MKRDEILSEFKKGVKARKYNRHYIDPDRESETLIAPRTLPKKKDDVKEQRSDYTKDEIVAVLTGQRTQAEVDAEALRTRGPDKGSTATPTTRPTTTTTTPVKAKEATGDAVGKITKVDPNTKKATISKPDGTTQEIDSTELKPTPDGKMQMDAPDTDEIKTGTDVVSTEEALSQPGYSQSPIHGGEDHDEISKLLVQRLRKLAGLQEEPDAATGQYGDGQVEATAEEIGNEPKEDAQLEADAGKINGWNIPPMPDISGLQPGQTKDLGDGQRVEIGRDGNVNYSGGFGKVVYSPQGKPLSYDSPRVGGVGMKRDLGTGDTTTSYSAGPMHVSQVQNPQGQTTASKGTFRVGDGSFSIDQEYKDGQPTIQTRTGAGSQANADLVKNQDTLNRARQARPTAEDKQLEALLHIAGLR